MSQVRAALRRAVLPSLAIVTAFLLGAVFIVLTDFEHMTRLADDPAGALGGAIGVVLEGYGAMLSGAIGDPARIAAAIQSGSERDIARAIRPISESLLSATPLIFITLGVGVAFHARLFNFGADTQFVFGGFGAAVGVIALAGILPPGVLLVAALAVGAMFGAAWGFIPGFLKARTGAHEIITTLMLNTIGFQLLIFIGSSGLLSASPAAFPEVPLLSSLPTIRLDWGFPAALLTAAVVSFVLFRTGIGFELRAAGFSETVARSVGMRPNKATVMAFVLSGGLAGLGGAFFALGPAAGRGGGGSGTGLETFALAFLAGLRPSAIVVVAIVYGAMTNGARSMTIATGIPNDVLVVVIALAMMFVAAPGMVRWIWRVRIPEPAHHRVPVET